MVVDAMCSREGLNLGFACSETPETIILTTLGGVAWAAPYAQAQACSRMRIARSGNESELTRAARLSRTFTFTLSLGIEHGVRFTEWEEWTWVRLVRVVIVGRSGIRVGERRRDTAGYVGECGRGGTIRFLEELSWVGVVPCSRSRVGRQMGGRRIEIGSWRQGGKGKGRR